MLMGYTLPILCQLHAGQEDMKSLLEKFLALDLVVLRSQTTSLLFCPERFVLMRLSDEGLRAAELALTLDCTDALVETSKITDFLRTTVDYVSRTPRLEIFDVELIGSTGKSRSLPKLVLMVNNCCNLQCRYCYEHETVFKVPARCISRSAIRTTIDKCYERFDAIGTIMFIGGEPTLSEEAIEEACAYAIGAALRLAREKPGFGMITNGVRMSEHLHEVIEKYEIQLTFSVDGPKATNDLIRIRKDGTGSYDAVSLNIKRYAELHADTISIESTVTRAQSDAGLSVSQLMNFIAMEFGVMAPHISLACSPDGHVLMPAGVDAGALDDEFLEAVDLSVTNILAERRSGDRSNTGPRLRCIADTMRALGRKSATTAMCSAGTAQLVVDSHADVYPCWMFAGNSKYRMGNIVNDSFEQILGSAVLSKVIVNTKIANTNCSSCYARFLCHACIGSNHIRTGSIEEMDPRFCDRTRRSLVAVLSAIARTDVGSRQ